MPPSTPSTSPSGTPTKKPLRKRMIRGTGKALGKVFLPLQGVIKTGPSANPQDKTIPNGKWRILLAKRNIGNPATPDIIAKAIDEIAQDPEVDQLQKEYGMEDELVKAVIACTYRHTDLEEINAAWDPTIYIDPTTTQPKMIIDHDEYHTLKKEYTNKQRINISRAVMRASMKFNKDNNIEPVKFLAPGKLADFARWLYRRKQAIQGTQIALIGILALGIPQNIAQAMIKSGSKVAAHLNHQTHGIIDEILDLVNPAGPIIRAFSAEGGEKLDKINQLSKELTDSQALLDNAPSNIDTAGLILQVIGIILLIGQIAATSGNIRIGKLSEKLINSLKWAFVVLGLSFTLYYSFNIDGKIQQKTDQVVGVDNHGDGKLEDNGSDGEGNTDDEDKKEGQQDQDEDELYHGE